MHGHMSIVSLLYVQLMQQIQYHFHQYLKSVYMLFRNTSLELSQN